MFYDIAPHQMVHWYFSVNEMYLKTQLKVKFGKKKCRCPLSNIGNSLCIWDSPYWYDKLKGKKPHIFCRKLDQKIWNSNAKFDGQKDTRTVWWNDWKLID